MKFSQTYYKRSIRLFQYADDFHEITRTTRDPQRTKLQELLCAMPFYVLLIFVFVGTNSEQNKMNTFFFPAGTRIDTNSSLKLTTATSHNVI